jgi:hypothetical protein
LRGGDALTADPWVPQALEHQWTELHAWWSKQKGVRACRGVPNTHPVLRPLGGDIHTDCCVQPLMLTLPDGVTVEDMLTLWASQSRPGTSGLIAEHCLDQWRRWRDKHTARPTSHNRFYLDRWTTNRRFWLARTRTK